MTAHDDKREALELALAINENLEPCLSQDDVKLITVALRAYADAPYLHPILAAQRGKPAYEAEKAALSHEPKKTEQCRSAHEAESHAPRIREGDSGVAPGRGSAAPSHVRQTPVAWRWRWNGGDEPDVWSYCEYEPNTKYQIREPLYAAPVTLPSTTPRSGEFPPVIDRDWWLAKGADFCIDRMVIMETQRIVLQRELAEANQRYDDLILSPSAPSTTPRIRRFRASVLDGYANIKEHPEGAYCLYSEVEAALSATPRKDDRRTGQLDRRVAQERRVTISKKGDPMRRQFVRRAADALSRPRSDAP